MRKPTRLETLRRAIEQVRDESEVPSHLVAAAIAMHSAAPLVERFVLLAAASKETHQGLVCTSQSGLWTLEIFVGQSPQDQAAGRGQVLLSVHPDHRATYEGRTARIFVNAPEGERVLAEATVRNGELCADIVLTGLDLHQRDAINVIFGSGASP
jgi:hypothetical protein